MSLEIVGEVIKAVDRSVVQEKTSDITAHFLVETPPPIGQFSSGLSTLGVVLYLGIKQWGESRHIKGFYSTVSPMYIATIHQTRKYSKSDTVCLAKSLIKTFSDSGYIKSFLQVKCEEGEFKEKEMDFSNIKIIHDEADSLMFFTRLLYRHINNIAMKSDPKAESIIREFNRHMILSRFSQEKEIDLYNF